MCSATYFKSWAEPPIDLVFFTCDWHVSVTTQKVTHQVGDEDLLLTRTAAWLEAWPWLLVATTVYWAVSSVVHLLRGWGEKMQLKGVNYIQICNFQRQLVAFLSRDLFKQPHLLLLNAAAQPVSLWLARCHQILFEETLLACVSWAPHGQNAA